MSRLRYLYVYPQNCFSPVEPRRSQHFVTRNLASKDAEETKEPPLPVTTFLNFDTDFELVYLWSGLVDQAKVRQRWPDPDDQDGCNNEINGWYASATQLMHSLNKFAPLAVNYDTVVAAAVRQPQATYVLELRRSHKDACVVESLFAKEGQVQREDLFYLLPSSFDAVLEPGRIQDCYIPLTLCHGLVCDLLGLLVQKSQDAAIALSHRIPKISHLYDTPWFRFMSNLTPSVAVALAILEFEEALLDDADYMYRCFEALASALPFSRGFKAYPDRLYTLRALVSEHLPKPFHWTKNVLHLQGRAKAT